LTIKFCSEAITETLREVVLNHALAVLLDEIQEHRWQERALNLIHPLLRDFVANNPFFSDRRISERALQFCCHLLGENSGTLDDDPVRSKSVAILLHLIVSDTINGREPLSHTPAQFDLLVDYHLRICDGADDVAITDTLPVLTWLGGSPSTWDRTHRYIDTLLRFIGQKNYDALRAACAVSSAVVSMGRDDELLKEHVSEALASLLPSERLQTSINDSPFKAHLFLALEPPMPYLRLLCALSQEPAWHPQLHHNGHFNNCLVIAKALSSQGHNVFDNYAVPVAQIFAIMDASEDGCLLSIEDQMHAIWPLILRAWRYIFNLQFFGGAGERTRIWREISTMECINALPSLVEYARKRQDQSEETNHLLALVKQAYRKLDEDKPQCEHDGTQRIRDDPFW
jgi:hypothetical protein